MCIRDRAKMLDIVLFWAEKGIDGFRCDMAEMVPVEFWNWVIPKVKQAYDVCSGRESRCA